MTGEERRQQLSDVLARNGFADLSRLAGELGVSESTVRRDLTQLEEEGVVRRTHGGAGLHQRAVECVELQRPGNDRGG